MMSKYDESNWSGKTTACFGLNKANEEGDS